MKVKRLLLMSATALLTANTFAQALEVDWLYFSSNGSWISRTESLINQETPLKLPVANLSADQFWWHSSNPKTQLVWAQPDPLGLPKKGAAVEIQGESGLWLIKEVSASHLVLQQGKEVRYWPQSQWHLLNWTSSTDYGMSLTVLQAEKSKSSLFYAWQSHDLSAQVRYRLDESGKVKRLFQELIVSNLSDSDYQSPGYSYAQVSTRPVIAMRTMALEADSAMVSAPQAGESQGVPTLFSNQPIELKAGSHLWLPVSSTDLTGVERIYQIQWDSRQQGLVKAQSSIKLTSKTPLPDIAGPIKIGVFDQQVALLESQYQPVNSKEAVLNLGQSALVTMTSKLVREGQWKLEVSNRSQEDAVVDLTVSHWNGKTSTRIPMTVRVPAEGVKTVELELGAGGLIKPTK